MTVPSAASSDRPVEEIPQQRSTVRDWALLLAGPVLWITHFMAVYLYSEAACVARESDALPVPGADALVPVVVAATVVAAFITVWATLLSWRAAHRREGDEAALGWAGALLGALSVVAILAVGLPALAVTPC